MLGGDRCISYHLLQARLLFSTAGSPLRPGRGFDHVPANFCLHLLVGTLDSFLVD